MKKLLAIVLALAMLLSLAACDLGRNGDTPETTEDSNASQPEATNTDDLEGKDPADGTEPAGDADATDPEETTSLAGFLKLYGYTEADITPEHFVSFEDVTTEGKPGEVGSVGFIKIHVDKDATTQEDINAWFEKVYGKMTQLSKDGKLYKDYLLETEASSLAQLQEGFLWETLPGGSCCYAYGQVVLYIATSYSIDNGIYKMSISIQKTLD